MLLAKFIDIILHLDKYLGFLLQKYGVGIYAILFVVIFLETGLVIMPFLPGDSLLFVTGTIAAVGRMNIIILFVFLAAAAILGDSLNYWIGSFFGEKVFAKSRLFKKEYLERTKDFYRKHGGKTIILARFIPIMRTFAPFVAGVGKMRYVRFFSFNVIGGIAWVAIFLFGGYFFGAIPLVKANLAIITLAIIVISLIPAGLEFVRHFRKAS